MSEPTTIRVLLVDDHPVVREGLRSMLGGDDIAVVAEAATGAEAVRAAFDVKPDVVLLDMQLPDMEGVAALRAIKQKSPHIAALVLSMHDEPALVRKALAAGAAGYLLKGATRHDLRDAIRAAHAGASVIDPALAHATPEATAPTEGALTPIEHRVLALVADGLTNREISAQMRWSVATAKKYVQRILDKLGVADRTQAVARALRRGLLD